MLQQSSCSRARKCAVAVGNFPGGCGGSEALAPAPQTANSATKRSMRSELPGSQIANAFDCGAFRPRTELTDPNLSSHWVSSAPERAGQSPRGIQQQSRDRSALLQLCVLDQSITSRMIRDRESCFATGPSVAAIIRYACALRPDQSLRLR